MNAEAVFNRYDIRGDYPDEIDEGFAERLGHAVGTFARREQRGKVVVGRDAREASAAVHPALVRGVRAAGANVVDVGVGPTDRTALAATHYGGIGAMITASHHAWQRTGIKLLYEEGHGFSNDDLDRIKELFRDETVDEGSGNRLQVEAEFDETYIEQMTDAFDTVADRIEGDILVDATGPTERLAPVLLEEVGADVTEHGWDEPPDPEPTEASRSAVVERAAGFDAAVGYDPDGDRVYLVHPELGWIDGDRLLYLLAGIVDADTIAASIDTSPLVEETGADIHYSRVGDVFVAEEGRSIDADLLGEPNGHYAVPAFSWYNSGIFSSLLLCSIAQDIPSLLEPVTAYETRRYTESYGSMEERDEAMQRAMKRVAQAFDVVSTVDGVKFEDGDITGLARPSGTSPKIRLVLHGTGTLDNRAESIRAQVLG